MKKTIKIYEEQGIQYRFDSEKLSVLVNKRKQFLRKKQNSNATKAGITDELSEMLCVSNEAIKNWMYGYNGPSDLEQVEQIGKYFEIDYHELLKEVADMKANKGQVLDGFIQNTYTREVIRKLYRDILHYIDSCETVFLNLTMYEDGLKKEEYEKFVADVKNESKALHSELDDLTEYVVQSYLDIPTEFYEKISNYCWGKLENLANMVTDFEYDLEDEKMIYPHLDEGNFFELDEYFENEYLKEVQDMFKEFVIR